MLNLSGSLVAERKDKVKKILKYTIIGIVSCFLIVLGFFSLLQWAKQGEFLKYDEGVTIEVHNVSNQVITDLNFYLAFNENHIYQDLGTITQIEPGETTFLYSHQIKGKGNQSLYIQYPFNKTEKESESLAYLPSYNPSKVVVILEITDTDNKGKLLLKGKGYEDVFGQYEFDITTTSE